MSPFLCCHVRADPSGESDTLVYQCTKMVLMDLCCVYWLSKPGSTYIPGFLLGVDSRDFEFFIKHWDMWASYRNGPHDYTQLLALFTGDLTN
jgi:hypothetical protein